MLNWILFIFLLATTIITFKINKGYFITPSVIVSGITTLSSFIVAVNTKYWQYTLSLATVCIILVSVWLFCLGQILGNKIDVKNNLLKRKDVIAYDLKKPNNLFYCCAIIFGLITLVLYFIQQYKNAANVGMTGSFSEIIEANRFHDENAEHSSIVRLLFVSLKSVAYVVLSIYLNDKIYNGRGGKFLQTIIILALYLLCAILTTNRADFIAAAGTTIFYLFYFIYKKNKWNAKSVSLKTVLKILLIFIIALFLFRSLGYLTGKSETSSFIDNINIYAGSSLICFDQFVIGESGIAPETKVILFKGLVNISNMLKLPFEFKSVTIPFQYWTNGSSNVYSSFFPLMLNYGVVGLFVVQLILGFFYGWFWKKIRTSNISWTGLLVYAQTFFYYICMYSIAERIFSQFITMTTFVEIFVIWILLNSLLKKKDNLYIVEGYGK